MIILRTIIPYTNSEVVMLNVNQNSHCMHGRSNVTLQTRSDVTKYTLITPVRAQTKKLCSNSFFTF
jgi:hypothetical protein